MKGRPTLFENSELVHRAQAIFWEKGYTATSLSDLLSVTGVGSGSFYNSFKGGKKEIFRAALLQRRTAFDEFRKELEKSKDPLDRIKDFFKSISRSDQADHLRGCIIANTIVEMTYIDEELEAEAICILKDVEQMFIRAIETEKGKGRIHSIVPTQVLGKYLVTFWCGLNTLRRMYPEQEILAEQIEMQLAVVS